MTLLVTFAFVIAASANFPPLLLALYWLRFNTTGALTGVAFGLVGSIVMLALSPTIWPGPDSEGSPSPLTYPAIVTVPFAFLGCWLGTVVGGRPDNPRSYDELLVRGETGMGSEGDAQAAPAVEPAPAGRRTAV